MNQAPTSAPPRTTFGPTSSPPASAHYLPSSVTASRPSSLHSSSRLRSNDGTIGVFLLDDHEVVRRGLRELFEEETDFRIVGESDSALEAMRRIPALSPDVAILDARLPDGSGIDVCRHIRSVDPTIAALILTSYDDDEALFAAILSNAAGYLLKQARGTDLITAVRQVAQGKSLLDPEVTARVLERLRNGPAPSEELKDLTEQERRILGYLAEGMTNRQIGEKMFLAEKTVKNYVSSLLSKLNLERRTQAAVLGSKLLGTPDNHQSIYPHVPV